MSIRSQSEIVLEYVDSVRVLERRESAMVDMDKLVEVLRAKYGTELAIGAITAYLSEFLDKSPPNNPIVAESRSRVWKAVLNSYRRGLLTLGKVFH
jgi:hypothetical protein